MDGEPLFGGWPAFYKCFFEKYHLNLEEVHKLPIYLACILLGAHSPDHTNFKTTWKDTIRYFGADNRKMRLLGKIMARGEKKKERRERVRTDKQKRAPRRKRKPA